MQSTITLTLNLTTKKGLITDTTDYDALGFTQEKIELGLGKGLGTLKFNGIIIEQRLDVNNPLIDLETGARTFEFDLVLDNNFAPAYGIYSIDYSVRFAPTGLEFAPLQTGNILADVGANYFANFLIAGNEISINGTVGIERTIEEVDVVSGIALYTLNEDVVWSEYDNYSFDVTNPTFSNEWAYMGCTQAEACPTFVADCDAGTNGSFTVDDNTQLNGATIVGLNCKISYPSWTKLENPSFNPDIVVTSLPYNNTTLATGTYSVILTLQLSQVESNGLILTYNTVSSKEFPVSCINSMCGMTSCIEKLNEAQQGASKSSAYTPLLQSAVNTVNLQTDLYYAYRSCGQPEKAMGALTAIQNALNTANIACNCGCGGEDELFWVQNTANSTTQYIDQVKALVAFRLINGVPDETTDSSVGVLVGYVYENIATGIEYRCVDNTVGAAVWVVHYIPSTYFYEAIVNQTGTDEPVFTNVVTNIEGDPLVSVDSTGVYTVGFGGTELQGNCYVTINNGVSGNSVGAQRISDSSFRITTSIGATPTNGVLVNATLRIDVKP